MGDIFDSVAAQSQSQPQPVIASATSTPPAAPAGSGDIFDSVAAEHSASTPSTTPPAGGTQPPVDYTARLHQIEQQPFSGSAWNRVKQVGETSSAAADVLASDTLDAVKGAVHAFNPNPQTPEEVKARTYGLGLGAMYIYRMLNGLSPVARAAIHPTEIAKAIHDINASKDPTGTYLEIARDTASKGAAQALTAIGTEGVVKGAVAAAPKLAEGATHVYNAATGTVDTVKNSAVIAGEKVAQPGARAAFRKAPTAAGETAAARPTIVMEDANPPTLRVDAEGNPIEVDGQHRAAKLVTAGKGDQSFTINYTDAAGKTTEQEITADQFLKRINRTPEDILKTDEQQTGVRAGKGEPRPATQKPVATAPTAEAPKSVPAGIRTTLEDPIKTIEAKGQGIYRQLDEVSGGKFQKYSDAIDKINKRLDTLIGGVDGEAGIDDDMIERLEQQKSEIETSQNQMFENLKETKGVDQSAVDTANAHWKQARALEDLERKVFKNPNIVKGNLKYGTTETVNIDPAIKALQKMQDDARFGDSRLEQALGEKGADALLKDLYKAQREGVHALNAQKWAKMVIKYGLLGAGATGLAHEMLSKF
jgi:hypothetical protein